MIPFNPDRGRGRGKFRHSGRGALESSARVPLLRSIPFGQLEGQGPKAGNGAENALKQPLNSKKGLPGPGGSGGASKAASAGLSQRAKVGLFAAASLLVAAAVAGVVAAVASGSTLDPPASPPPPPPLAPGQYWGPYAGVMEQYFQTAAAVEVDIYTLDSIIARIARATGIGEGNFTASYQTVDQSSASEGGSGEVIRRLSEASLPLQKYTDVSNATCEDDTVSFISVMLLSNDPVLIEMLRQAVTSRDGGS